MRKITEIIVHCTATRRGEHHTVAEIDEWHRKRGWDRIGYHYVVYLDGSIHGGRPEESIGAHCVGHNRNSIGVVYVGGLSIDGSRPEDTRNPLQKGGLLRLLRVLKKKYPEAVIRGHRDFAAKACPCFDATKEYVTL